MFPYIKFKKIFYNPQECIWYIDLKKCIIISVLENIWPFLDQRSVSVPRELPSIRSENIHIGCLHINSLYVPTGLLYSCALCILCFFLCVVEHFKHIYINLILRNKL